MSDFDAGLFKPVCTSLIAAFAAEGHPLGRAKAHEILAAALGFWTYSLAREHATPLAIRPAPVVSSLQELPRHWAHLTERLEGILGVSTWVAQFLAPIVQRIVRESGLAVDTHSLIYDPKHHATRHQILLAIDDPHFAPSRASHAMRRGLLPFPQRTSLKDRLDDVAPQFAGGYSNRTAHLWLKPSAQLRSVASAFEDSFHVVNNAVRARLGLNFTIVMPGKDLRGQPHFTLLSPTVSFREKSPHAWHVDGLVRGVVTDAGQQAAGEPKLEDLVGHPVADLPQLHLCPRCLLLHLPGHPELGSHCLGPVDASHVSNAVRQLHASGATSVTTHQIADAMQVAGHFETDLAAVDEFLDRNSYALKLRRIGSDWVIFEDTGPH